jgi:hypothetical protein
VRFTFGAEIAKAARTSASIPFPQYTGGSLRQTNFTKRIAGVLYGVGARRNLMSDHWLAFVHSSHITNAGVRYQQSKAYSQLVRPYEGA